MTVLESGGPELAALAATLDPARRERVARGWTLAARCEHASVASFARLSIQLMCVGAPPELLDAAHCAARDEIRHARLSFAVASAYSGRQLGPGPLPIAADALGAMDFSSIIRANVADGCVGETVASFEAEAQRDAVAHPTLSQVLEIIATDEAQHAGLAYQIVGWALEQRPSDARAAVREGFETGMLRYDLGPGAGPATEDVAEEPWLAEHGLLSPNGRRAARMRAFEVALAPAARELAGL